MIGRVYTWRGRRWTVLARWRPIPLGERTMICPGCGLVLDRPSIWCSCVPMPDSYLFAAGPRNVLIEDEDGNRVVRPFRGLRRAKEDA